MLDTNWKWIWPILWLIVWIRSSHQLVTIISNSRNHRPVIILINALFLWPVFYSYCRANVTVLMNWKHEVKNDHFPSYCRTNIPVLIMTWGSIRELSLIFMRFQELSQKVQCEPRLVALSHSESEVPATSLIFCGCLRKELWRLFNKDGVEIKSL